SNRAGDYRRSASAEAARSSARVLSGRRQGTGRVRRGWPGPQRARPVAGLRYARPHEEEWHMAGCRDAVARGFPVCLWKPGPVPRGSVFRPRHLIEDTRYVEELAVSGHHPEGPALWQVSGVPGDVEEE